MHEQRTIRRMVRFRFIQEVFAMTHVIHKTIKSRADGLELSVLEVVPEGPYAVLFSWFTA